MYQEYQKYNFDRLNQVTEMINKRLIQEKEANKSMLYRLLMASKRKQAKELSQEDTLLIEYQVRTVVHSFLCDPKSVSETDIMLANQYSCYMDEPLFRVVLSDMNRQVRKAKQLVK